MIGARGALQVPPPRHLAHRPCVTRIPMQKLMILKMTFTVRSTAIRNAITTKVYQFTLLVLLI